VAGGNERGGDGAALVAQLREWGQALGFSQIGVAGVDLSQAEPGLLNWLAQGFHGQMHYMAAHGLKRARPAELVPGTVSIVTARMDYLPAALGEGWQALEWARLARPQDATVSLYARGRDYHKVLRARLQKLADRLAKRLGPFGHRVFTDSAPVLEVELASRSGLGWRGKHTLLLSREAGSMFFLGEIYVDLALPPTAPETAHCGACRACIDICPTGAIVGERLLDARRCISYLTIEHPGPIPPELRPLLGNRIYGCDDCQLICPWNKFARRAAVPDFDTREVWSAPTLLQLWAWDEAAFLRHTEGSPIRRIGHERWQRNLAVAMGNALAAAVVSPDEQRALRQALAAALPTATGLVAEHIAWALTQQPAEPPGPGWPAPAPVAATAPASAAAAWPMPAPQPAPAMPASTLQGDRSAAGLAASALDKPDARDAEGLPRDGPTAGPPAPPAKP
jgi:epoxyqueuosine reductase